MRRIVTVAVALLSATALAACGANTNSSSPSGNVTLTLWTNYGTTTNAKVTTDLTHAYEAIHPNVKFKVVSQPADNYFSLLQATAISHNGPDLAVMWGGLYALKYKSLMTNLKGMVPSSDLAKLYGERWFAPNFDLSQGAYVVPLDQAFYMGYYNKTAFQKAGIASVPRTWTELYADCGRLRRAGYTPIVYGNGGQGLGAEFFPWYDMSYIMAGLYSVDQWKGLYSGSIPWTAPANVTALSRWAAMRSQGCLNSNILTTTDNLTQFMKGKAAMIVDGTWDSQAFTSALKGAAAPILLPFSTTPMPAVVDFAGDGYAITSYSPHKTQAAAFLKWLTTPAAGQIETKDGDISDITGIAPTNPLNQQILQLVHTPGNTTYPMIDNVVQGNVVDAGSKVLPPVLAGSMSPMAALKNLQQTWQALPASQRGPSYG